MRHATRQAAMVVALSALLCACAIVCAEDGGERRKEGGQGADASDRLSAKTFGGVLKCFPGSKVLKVESKEDFNVLLAVALWDIYEPKKWLKITLLNARGEKFKTEFDLYGVLLAADEHDVPFADLLPDVSMALRQWAPDAEWRDVTQARKKRDEKEMLYKVAGKLDGKTIKAEVFEDGSFRKRDKLPAVKAETPPSAARRKEDSVP